MAHSLETTQARGFRFPFAYDVLLKLLFGRSEHDYRERLLDLAQLSPGDSVLDVGCGTGTLAIAAKQRTGAAGRVTGVDISREMLIRARAKARAKRLEIDFRLGAAEELPVATACFDVVLSTTVLHCLPTPVRPLAVCEMARTLKPRGRLLLADYGGLAANRHSLLSHMKAHSRFDLMEMIPEVLKSGLEIENQGTLGFADLHFVLVRNPAERVTRDVGATSRRRRRDDH